MSPQWQRASLRDDASIAIAISKLNTDCSFIFDSAIVGKNRFGLSFGSPMK